MGGIARLSLKQVRTGYGSQEAGYVVRDEARLRLERSEGFAQCGIALLDRLVEAIVGGSLLRYLPNALDRVELGASTVVAGTARFDGGRGEPELPFLLEVVAGAVVDDQEDLASASSNEQQPA